MSNLSDYKLTISTNDDLSLTGNITGGNIVSGGVANITGNITGANLIAGPSGTGNVYARNIISNGVTISGQPTSYGIVNGNYAKYTRTTSQSVSANSVVVCNVAESSSGSGISVNTSNGQVTLTAGKTYRLRGTVGTIVGSAAGSLLGYGWYNETTSAWIGEGAGLMSPGSTNYNTSTSGTAEYVFTPGSTTVVSLRVIYTNNITSIGGNQSDFAGTYANPWIDIEDLNPTIAVQATATGTLNTDYIQAGRITSSQTVSYAATPQDVIFNTSIATNSGIAHNTSTGVFTLTAGKTYELEAQLTYGTMAAANNYILFTWVDATTNGALDTSGSSVGSIVPTSWGTQVGNPNSSYGAISKFIYTPNTNQTVKVRITAGIGSGSIFAGQGTYAKITQIANQFALNALDTMSVTGNVSANYFIGNGSQLTGITAGTNYTNSNVATFLASFGSNTLSTTGNVSAGNFIGSLANGNSNISIATAAGNVVTSVNGSAILTTYSGGIKVGGSGILQSPGGAGSITLNNNGANIPTANITSFLNVTGTSGANILGTANTGIGALNVGVTTTPLANTVASFNSNVNYYTQVTLQNKSTGTDATADFVITADNGSDTVNYLDLGIINSGYDNGTPTNSLGNIVFAADSYIYAQGNTSATGQSGGNLAIGTTVASKTVKIFAGGVTSNSIVASFANTGANITGSLNVSGNITGANISGNISITGNIQGTSSNVSLVAGSYTMTFDNTGILTLPRMGGDEGGEINFGIPASNTTLTSRVTVDVYQDRFRIFDGSTKGVYVDLSQAGTGVGTLLNNRVSAFVNAGTFVTMDLIKATVTTSGNRGLSLATTTGTFSYNIGGNLAQFGVSGGSAVNAQTLTTTATTSIFGWNFGAAGDLSTYILTDTTNSRCYRITLMIGTSYSNNAITIERLI